MNSLFIDFKYTRNPKTQVLGNIRYSTWDLKNLRVRVDNAKFVPITNVIFYIKIK